MMNRRRFLWISAGVATAAISTKGGADTGNIWKGRAFGADVLIQLNGSTFQSDGALRAALDTIRRLESYFSIYDPSSLLSRLNRDGRLEMPPEFARLMRQAEYVHKITKGLFDPTVQSLFAAQLAHGGTLTLEQRRRLADLTGWKRVNLQNTNVQFSNPGMALTLNGIAQGFATDRVSEVLEAHGFASTHINIGEYRANHAAMKLQVADARGSPIINVDVENGAVATSDIDGYTFPDGTSHIIKADGRRQLPRWRTASVYADTATVADGVSTALLLAPDEALARDLLARNTVRSIVLQTNDGDVVRL